MPKKIENYLKEGIPSQIYLLTYPEEKTTPQLASMIYGPDKKHFASRISEWIKVMGPKYIKDMGPRKGYKAIPLRLVDQIKNDLEEKGYPLKPKESKQLRKLLESNEFKETISISLRNYPGCLGEYSSPLEFFYHLIGFGAYITKTSKEFLRDTGIKTVQPMGEDVTKSIDIFIPLKIEMLDKLTELLPTLLIGYFNIMDIRFRYPFGKVINTVKKNRQCWQVVLRAFNQYNRELKEVGKEIFTPTSKS